jgi:hypothetical protein
MDRHLPVLTPPAELGLPALDVKDAGAHSGSVQTPDPELAALRQRAARGESDAVDELIERAAERGDLDELRRLADSGSRDAADQLVETAGETGDLDELRRLAARGNRDAADVLEELEEEAGGE